MRLKDSIEVAIAMQHLYKKKCRKNECFLEMIECGYDSWRQRKMREQSFYIIEHLFFAFSPTSVSGKFRGPTEEMG